MQVLVELMARSSWLIMLPETFASYFCDIYITINATFIELLDYCTWKILSLI